MRERLKELHNELMMAGAPDRAREVAKVLRSSALKAAAEYTRRTSMYFAQTGPRSLLGEEKSKHEAKIVALGDQLDALSCVDAPTYQQFDKILHQLHLLGFFPDGALVSDVAQAIHLEQASLSLQ